MDDDPHLHVDLRDRNSKYSPYPSVVEAYFRDFPDAALPNGGGNYYAQVGDTVTLDASRTAVRPGRKLEAMTWTLHDGRTVSDAVVPVAFDALGLFIEELTVRTDDGFVDKDFAYVRVYEPEVKHSLVRGYLFYAPQREVTPDTSVDFWVYIHNATEGKLDFGDGSSPVALSAKEGTTSHRYSQPGLYVVRLEGPDGTVAKTRVHVDGR